MPLTETGPAIEGDFAPINAELDARGARRIRATGPRGTYDAYALDDGRIVNECLRVPSAATVTENEAVAAAATTERTKRAAAIDVVRTQVARVRAIAPASRTNSDRWLLALSYLLFTEE